MTSRLLNLAAIAKRIFKFAVISGGGLFIDIFVFSLLIAAGVSPILANICSAFLAVTFVYFVSIRKVFSYEGRFRLSLFMSYCLFQVVAVLGASAAIQALVQNGVIPIVAKIAILPLTFSANYLAMHTISQSKRGSVRS